MAEARMGLPESLRKGEEPAEAPLQQIVRWAVQELMEAEGAAQIGAGRYERTEERNAQRNGYRPRTWDTRVGSRELQIPQLRQGSYLPSWLEPRRRAEQALVAVVAEAYVQGGSTRKVEALVHTLGIAGMSKSEVSRLAARLDAQVEAFRTRRLDAASPYVWGDARYEHVREDSRVVSMAVIGAYGVRADGMREVLGLAVGLSEDVAVWRAFFQRLVGRGLQGVQRVISDAPPGFKPAIREVFVGAGWQRCRVHFLRNLADAVSGDAGMTREAKRARRREVLQAAAPLWEATDREEFQRRRRAFVAAWQEQEPQVVAKLEAGSGATSRYLDALERGREWGERWRPQYLRTTSLLERANRALRQKLRQVGVCQSKTGLYAVLALVVAHRHLGPADDRPWIELVERRSTMRPSSPDFFSNCPDTTDGYGHSPVSTVRADDLPPLSRCGPAALGQAAIG